MRNTSRPLAALIFCCWTQLTAQPVIADQGVTNGASYSIIGAPGAGVAPGSIMVIFGSGLGPAALQSASAYPLQTELGQTSVKIGDTPAYMLYTSSTQIAAIVPSSVTTGVHPITVTYNNRTSPAVSVPVVQTDFGLFTRNAAGYGQAAAQSVFPQDGSVRTLGLATSVQPGEPVVLYGTGIGAITGTPDDRPPGAGRTTVPVQVIIGGKLVIPDYAGRSPNYAGLDQINFTVPADLTPGCYVPAAIRANGRLSNVVSIPVAQTGRACIHPFGISESAAARIDQGSNITIGGLEGERRTSENGPAGEGVGIGFAEVNANSLEIAADPSTNPSNSFEPGKCEAEVFDTNATVIRRPSVSRARYLDAGAVVRLTGPSFQLDLPRSPDNTYGTNLPNGTLRPGTWSFSSGGGSAIGAFQFSSDLPEPLVWTNRQESFDPNQPLRLDWTSGISNPTRIVLTAGADGPGGTRFASIVCLAGSQQRTITIPAALLGMLPSGGRGGIIFTQPLTKSGFRAPLAQGGSTDGALLRIIYQTTGPVRLQ